MQGYLGLLEAAHYTHCLNDFRKHWYKDYFPEIAAADEESSLLADLYFDHCINMLRQKVMCNADPGIMNFRWVRGVSEPYPDFYIDHQCQSYQGLLDWNEKRAVDIPDDFVWTVPADAKVQDEHT